MPSSSASGGGSTSRRTQIFLIALAILIPLAPIVAGIVLSDRPAARPAPALVVTVAPTRPTAPPPRRASPATGALVGYVRDATAVRTAPGGEVIARQSLTTGFGSHAVVLVRRRAGGWLGVVTPLAGNHRLGWIPESAVSLTRVQWKLEVSLARRELTVIHRASAIRHFKIAIGRPTAPTPTGYFAVTDLLATHDPTGPYGCCILALSAEAPHEIQGWYGGNRIAIHSTPETSSIGLAVSHGCMRLTLAEGQWLLDHIPQGTPTIIRS